MCGCSDYEQEFRDFKDKMPRKKFGYFSDEIEEEQRKLHNAQLHNLHDEISMREIRTTYKIVTADPHRKNLPGRQCWEDNIKI